VAYPAHLPPAQGALYLSSDELRKGSRQLVRRLERMLEMDADPEAPLMLAGSVCSPAERVLDLSVNVLGTFRTDDCAWRVTGASDAPWAPPTWPTTVHVQDIQHISESAWYVLPFERLHRANTGILLQSKEVSCCICYKPTQANYWHFTLNFYTTDGELMTLTHMGHASKSGIQKCADRLRNWLREQIGSYPQQVSMDDPIPWACCNHPQEDSCHYTTHNPTVQGII
jgi:hypothetical protein